MPITDYQAAAQSIVDFLKLLTSTGRMRLRYRIVAGAGAADPDGMEAREIYVELSGPDAHLLTERNGELLRALEHVAAKMIHLESEEHDKVSFDANNFKAMRAQDLRMRAQVAADTVQQSRQPFAFPPSNSRERRLLHLALSTLPGVESASVGEGVSRMLVVFPEGFDKSNYTPPPVAPQRREPRAGADRDRRRR